MQCLLCIACSADQGYQEDAHSTHNRGENGARGAEYNQSECPLTARGGPHRGFDETIPRYAPPRVWAGDPWPLCTPLALPLPLTFLAPSTEVSKFLYLILHIKCSGFGIQNIY